MGLTAWNASSPAGNPVRLPTSLKEKVWGATRLSPWFPDSQSKIGEAWFEADLPLLVKFIFTTERLSVQVHPNDEFAALHENSRGKTEMWHILQADHGARIALGFRESISKQRLREASLSGEIENLLRWVDVRPGETYFVPAGTVHAIGAGIVLAEIQQHSDVTYRLYDYGRPRELHLDKALQVSDLSTHASKPAPLPVDCRYFHTELATIQGSRTWRPDPAHWHILIVIEGFGEIAEQAFQAGQAWFVPAGSEPFTIAAHGTARLLWTRPGE